MANITFLENKIEILDELLKVGLETANKKNGNFTKDEFHKLKNEIYKKYKIAKPFQSIELIERYNELIADGSLEENLFFKKVLRKRGVRSLSGVTVISLLTKFFGCPGKCIYCPTFEGLPKSYIPNEPAVQRAVMNDFDPILQIHNRLRALEITGHKIEKNDIRIIGGTWSVYPLEYQKMFIKAIYDAFNTYDDMKVYLDKTDLTNDKFATFKLKEGYKARLSKNIEEAKKLNETSRLRVIGIAIETRPDWVNPEEIKRLREYGVTRVEIGYQTTNDEINKLNKRGHGNKESIEATRMLKDAGFKVVAHMMPNLLGSTPELDILSLKEVFDNPDFRPDELKIYPMMVTDKSELTEVWKNGGFKAYDDETLIELTATLQMMIPEYIRLNRTYRDIPSSEILEGSIIANLRQIVEKRIKEKGVKLLDTRYREIKDGKNDPNKAVLHNYEYDASKGKEYFLTFEDPDDRTIFSLLRLRLPGIDKEILNVIPELEGCAIIREIHTFGDQLNINEKGSTFGQHIGFGKKLILESEKIAKENGYNKMAVIAGVGVREYYKKRGYELIGEYMIKKIA
ncbi:MAG: tRNA uridine(34) 5-carboxymethylaminomethyl modification radical SAM/GNAT enzyme Elp3 [Candidatus Gracilibacteria bacterium]|nr:tRNA uridine(34) 5-carboxymethylaminomethyl modification radical SAM/GNAT enzyme Elp3 [Candidatus Gracilibacteria bacterium]